MGKISYEIRTVDKRERRTFEDPYEAAKYWNVSPPLTRLFVFEGGKHWSGTPEMVKPVYDALEKVRAEA